MKDYVNEFFKDHRFVLWDGRKADSRRPGSPESTPGPASQDLRLFRSRYICKDGFNFSVQAGPLLGCSPQGYTGPYTHVETSGLHQKHKVDKQVAVDELNDIIEAHGGPDFDVMEQVGDGQRIQLELARGR